MKIIAIGDTHGRPFWKDIVNNETFDLIIFIGDYFDSFQINTETQVNNFLDIIAYKKANPDKVILLIGNHDHHYFPEIGNTGTSGYQHVGKFLIEPVLDENRKYLQMAYQYDNFVFTHAGIGETFMNDVFGMDGWNVKTMVDDLNELWLHKPKAFIFNGFSSTGDDLGQTPIWIRPRSLMRDSQLLKKAGIIQIIGHTHFSSIDIKGKSTGGKYFFIDTFDYPNREFLIIENNKLSVKKAKYETKSI